MRKPHSRWTADTQIAFLMALKDTGQARKAAEAIALGMAFGPSGRTGAVLSERMTGWGKVRGSR